MKSNANPWSKHTATDASKHLCSVKLNDYFLAALNFFADRSNGVSKQVILSSAIKQCLQKAIDELENGAQLKDIQTDILSKNLTIGVNRKIEDK